MSDKNNFETNIKELEEIVTKLEKTIFRSTSRSTVRARCCVVGAVW